jgi:hypothetical protein
MPSTVTASRSGSRDPAGFRAMRRTVVPVLAALGLLGAVPATASAAFRIDVGRFSVSSIGDFRPSRDASIPAATRVFGPASARRGTSGSSCRVRWSRLRLEIVFVSFDAPGLSRCRGTIGRAQTFKVRGGRFRTWHGLRVGMRESEVKRRHPGAAFRDGAWWLKTAVSPFGDPDAEFAVLDAKIGPDGRVRVMRGWIGGAGD